jgi:hypothetical protein
MEKAFPWLCGFVVSQLALMAAAALPLERWRSFQITISATRSKNSRPENAFTGPELAIETK